MNTYKQDLVSEYYNLWNKQIIISSILTLDEYHREMSQLYTWLTDTPNLKQENIAISIKMILDRYQRSLDNKKIKLFDRLATTEVYSQAMKHIDNLKEINMYSSTDMPKHKGLPPKGKPVKKTVKKSTTKKKK